MILKSGSEFSICVSLMLLSWGFGSALYIHPNERALDTRSLYVLSDMVSLFETKQEIASNEVRIQQLKSRNAELNDFLKKIVDRTTRNLVLSKETEVDELIRQRVEKLQSQIASGTAAIEDLKRQVEKLVSKTDFDALQDVLKDMEDISGWGISNDGSVVVFQSDGEGGVRVALVLQESQVDKQLYHYEDADEEKSESESENDSPVDDGLDQITDESELETNFVQKTAAMKEDLGKDKDQIKDEDKTEFKKDLFGIMSDLETHHHLEDLVESQENDGAVESQNKKEGKNEDNFVLFD